MERSSQERAAGADTAPIAAARAGQPAAGAGPAAAPASGRSRLPDATPWFWITQILTAGVGGTTADVLLRLAGPVLATALALFAAATALVAQFRTDRHTAWVYWPAVTAVSVAGAIAADASHTPGGVSHPVAAGVFGLAAAVTLAGRRTGERAPTACRPLRSRREAFHWATLLTACGLGTALADAAVRGLGHVTACAVLALPAAVPAIGALRFGLRPSAAFWSAYLLIRPLGACCADGMAAPLARGGLGWGAGPVSTLLAVVLAGLIGRLADEQRTAGTPPGPPHAGGADPAEAPRAGTAASPPRK